MFDTYNAQIPPVRLPEATKVALERIAKTSVSRKLSDHVRLAIEEYIAKHLAQVEGGKSAAKQ